MVTYSTARAHKSYSLALVGYMASGVAMSYEHVGARLYTCIDEWEYQHYLLFVVYMPRSITQLSMLSQISLYWFTVTVTFPSTARANDRFLGFLIELHIWRFIIYCIPATKSKHIANL